MWFMIEILSFYGYILAATTYILANSISSSLGWVDKTGRLKERYRHDFINFHRADLNWAAFVQILFNVNIVLILLDSFITFKDETDQSKFPLKHCTYILLFNHLLQMVFLRHFYDNLGRVNMGNKWVWGVHLVCYTYVLCIYLGTDARKREHSEATGMWIPLDCLLTVNICAYQSYF